MKENFNLREFLTENRLTSNSRSLKEEEEETTNSPQGISPEALSEIQNLFDSWPLEDLEETTDHFIEIFTTEIIPEFNLGDIPEGTLTYELDEKVMEVATQYHKGEIPIEEAAQKLLEIVKDPSNWKTSQINWA